MTDQKTCEYIVTNAGSVEAAIIISGSGLPLAWHTARDTAVDEVSSISAGLLAIARELHLFDTTSNASMIFETAFGAIIIRTIDADSLLVLCLLNGYSFLTINRLLQKVYPNESDVHQ
ncbi:MAG: roadblock/LC7 domain-containing protein [Chitinispirillaceae bacterium]|nr:roadblock/LC7 domain-containing protein [Chitinispirillaceae bacterium]